MHCKEDKNVNKFTIYFCWKELTVVQPGVEGSWPRFASTVARKLQAPQVPPGGSLLLPAQKEQALGSYRGSNFFLLEITTARHKPHGT